ncbi:MAG: hypothetical protein ACI9E4_001025 [Pseudohongiellaceae bacterium]
MGIGAVEAVNGLQVLMKSVPKFYTFSIGFGKEKPIPR